MTEDILRSLQKELDTYSLGFPATDSCVELEILRKLFTEEDAALNTLSNPAEYVFSNHFALIDQEACSGCEVCIDRC